MPDRNVCEKEPPFGVGTQLLIGRRTELYVSARRIFLCISVLYKNAQMCMENTVKGLKKCFES